MAILLTGATGCVVASLARHLAALGEDVIAADLVGPDAALCAYLAPLPGRVTFLDVDVTDAGAVERLVADTRPTRLVHGAAITAIPEDVERERFLRTTAVNVGGTLTVLEVARRAGVGRIVIVSSGKHLRSAAGPRSDHGGRPGAPGAALPADQAGGRGGSACWGSRRYGTGWCRGRSNSSWSPPSRRTSATGRTAIGPNGRRTRRWPGWLRPLCLARRG